ncbi:hypothetical protein BGX20_003037 [Mortierella sp. AD010]|nr:hypothetical protein BGX20_003037 [Mortierella sp. AD010]
MACIISRTWRLAITLNPTYYARGFHSNRTPFALNPALWPTTNGSPSHEAATVEDPIFGYCSQYSTSLPNKFMRLHDSSKANYPGGADKTVSALQGQLLQLLMRMTRPRRVLELGCFMGYSAMAMADGMPRGATLYTCEKDSKAARLARELFTKEGYDCSSERSIQRAVKIELLEGDAMSSLALLAKKELQFDAVFLDADKGNYINYFNFILDNNMLAQHGYILADNVLFRGMVLQSHGDSLAPLSPPPSPQLSPKTKDARLEERKSSHQKAACHMDKFNRHVMKDPRVTVAVLPIFDGLSVIMKNEN